MMHCTPNLALFVHLPIFLPLLPMMFKQIACWTHNVKSAQHHFSKKELSKHTIVFFTASAKYAFI